MAERPAKAVHTVLSAAVSLAGETIRIGMPQDKPDRGVWVIATGGFAPVTMTSDENLRRPTVQVFCRGVRGTEESLEALVNTAWLAIHRVPPTGYVSAIAANEPIQLQPDANERPRLTFNVELIE